jgi:hypothetical protein
MELMPKQLQVDNNYQLIQTELSTKLYSPNYLSEGVNLKDWTRRRALKNIGLSKSAKVDSLILKPCY